MENRRHSSATAPKKTYRKRSYERDEEKSSGYKGGYKSRSKRFQSNDGKYSKSGGGYKSNDSKYGSNKRYSQKRKGVPPWKKEHLPKIVSEMQITDGKHRGKYLKSSDSPSVKLTPRRIREVMFRILFRRVRAGRFLDLCSGIGTVGFEAISRGALVCTFVERKARTCSYIRKNMESLEVKEGHGEIFEMEAVPFLKQMAKRRRFWDVVFYDPPFDTDYDDVIKYLERGVSIRPGGVLVIQHPAEMFFPERVGVLKRWRVIVQGDSAISFYVRKS